MFFFFFFVCVCVCFSFLLFVCSFFFLLIVVITIDYPLILYIYSEKSDSFSLLFFFFLFFFFLGVWRRPVYVCLAPSYISTHYNIRHAKHLPKYRHISWWICECFDMIFEYFVSGDLLHKQNRWNRDGVEKRSQMLKSSPHSLLFIITDHRGLLFF